MKDILLEWRKYIAEQTDTAKTMVSSVTGSAAEELQPTEQDIKDQAATTIAGSVENVFHDAKTIAKRMGVDLAKLRDIIKKEIDQVMKEQLQESKRKRAKVTKKGDRCTRIAKRKYDVWPSAYASGAVVKCRQGKIWKGISENATDEEIDLILEKWSEKYKRSIDCKNPKGFSQKAHCQGKNKNEEIELDSEIIDEELDEAKKRDYKPNFSKEKEQGLHGWFARNKGKGWINCRTGGPCGRSSADKKGGKYPACRPTKAQCKSAGKGPLRRKKSSKPISWTKKKKKD